MISETLYNSLKNWLAEATSDEPNYLVRNFGLCGWVEEDRNFTRETRVLNSRKLINLLWAEFPDSPYFPFEDAEAFFASDMRQRNPARLAWVQSKLDEYEAGQK
jgi:hypothetical protein